MYNNACFFFSSSKDLHMLRVLTIFEIKFQGLQYSTVIARSFETTESVVQVSKSNEDWTTISCAIK